MIILFGVECRALDRWHGAHSRRKAVDRSRRLHLCRIDVSNHRIILSHICAHFVCYCIRSDTMPHRCCSSSAAGSSIRTAIGSFHYVCWNTFVLCLYVNRIASNVFDLINLDKNVGS